MEAMQGRVAFSVGAPNPVKTYSIRVAECGVESSAPQIKGEG